MPFLKPPTNLERKLGIVEKLNTLAMVPSDQKLGRHNVINATVVSAGMLEIEFFRFRS